MTYDSAYTLSRQIGLNQKDARRCARRMNTRKGRREVLFRLLEKHTDPETRLFLGIIEEAVKDLEVESQVIPARQYFLSEAFKTHANLCGLEPTYVARMLRDFELVEPTTRRRAAA